MDEVAQAFEQDERVEVFSRKTIVRMIALFAGSLVLAILASLLTFQFPSPGFHARIGDAIETLSWRSQFYPSIIEGRNFSRLDNHMDAIMVQLAMDNPTISVVEQAFEPLMVRAFYDEARGIPNQVKSLSARYYDGAIPDYHFGRYWHGYRAPLRLFGSFLTLQQLRILNFIGIGTLFLIASIAVCRTFDRAIMIAFILSLLAVSIYFVPMSLQYVSAFYILLVSVFALCIALERWAEEAPVAEIVVLSAIATAFFDLLTAPLAVVAILALLYALWLYRDRSVTARTVMARMGTVFALWFGTYAAFWAAKPLVARLFGIKGVGGETFRQVAKYFVDAVSSDWIHAIPYNLATFTGATSWSTNHKDLAYWLHVGAFFVIVLASLLIWKYLFAYSGASLTPQITKRYLPLLAVALTPFLWWQVTPWRAANHIFTYRELVVLLFALAVFYILTFYEARRVSQVDLLE